MESWNQSHKDSMGPEEDADTARETQKIIPSATDRRKPDASRRLLASLSDVRCGIVLVLDDAARRLREWRSSWC